jgi:23S rRNA (uridine2552-2'-O)-methyltransferase
VKQAKVENYRARSAFKLIELDDKYHFLKPSSIVIDCGACPGSWSQVAAERTRSEELEGSQLVTMSQGAVIAIDIQGKCMCGVCMILSYEVVHVLDLPLFFNRFY